MRNTAYSSLSNSMEYYKKKKELEEEENKWLGKNTERIAELKEELKKLEEKKLEISQKKENINKHNNNSTRTKTDKEDNLTDNENGINNEKQSKIISEQKQELELLRTRFEQLYRELNQYRQKNSDLNIEIKKLKD